MIPLVYLTFIVTLIIASGYVIYNLFNIQNPWLFGWLWFNLFIAIFEFYVVYHKNKFSEGKCPRDYWREHVDQDFWLKTWHEYTCQSDRRYLDKHSFVFNIELTNAVLVVLLWICYILGFAPGVVALLLIQIWVCVYYFLTLPLNRRDINTENPIKTVSYLFISSWWIFVPVYVLTRIRE
jgi:hypothetical protein